VFKLDHSILTVAAGTLSVALVMSAAHAFNPQPDPPAKQLAFSNTLKQKGGSPSVRRSVSLAPCKSGNSCRVVSPPPEPDGQKSRQ
jgi:hypothetical protein